MARTSGTILDLRALDRLATGNSVIHRLDGRAKVLVTLAFILAVVSVDRYQLSSLIPFCLFPAVMITMAGLPFRPILGKVAPLLPVALLVGIFNPLFDREVLVRLGPLAISGGWLSCASILLRTLLTVSAAFVLVASTGFTAICTAMDRLGMPRAFVVQLLLLYRYLHVLADEGGRMARARALRSFGRRGSGLHSFGPLLGQLLIRTWERAERIHRAMLARGFSGHFHLLRTERFRAAELVFLLVWLTLFVLFRLVDIPWVLGRLAMEVFA